MTDYSEDRREDSSTYADSTLQPPPTDDGTIASESLDSPKENGSDPYFEIGEPGDEESPVDLRGAGMSLPDPEELKVHRTVNDGCLKMWAWIIFTIVAVLSLTVGLAVGLSNKKEPLGATQSEFVPVTREEVRAAMQNYVIDNKVTSSSDLSSSTSPQSKALDFLANEDPMQLNAPLTDLTSDEGYTFITRYVMAVVFGALDGKNWEYDLLFKSKHDTCDWYDFLPAPVGKVGVLCSKDTKKVYGLSFIQNNLEGFLPSELAVLTSLTYLETIGNNIGGNIPDRFQQLTNLENVVLISNSITGSIPEWITKWSKLQVLYASDNAISGSIPSTLAQLTALRVLALDHNQMVGALGSVWEVSTLEYLYLDDNGFVGSLPSSIVTTSPSLRHLDLSSNQMVGDLPSDLFRVEYLEIVDLHDNKFSGLLPSDVAEDNNLLSFLALYDNDLSGNIPTQLGLLDQLVHLDLSSNRFVGDIPTELGNLAELGYLFLAENQFDAGPIPSFMYSLNNLQELSLKSSSRTGRISSSIVSLSKLEFLDLDNNSLTGSIPSQIGSLSNLEFLLLNRNTLSQDVPLQLGTLANLRFLLLDNNEVTGSVGQLCELKSLQLTFLDCDEVDCSCCKCCTDGVDNCHDNLEVANLDPSWERGYQRGGLYVFKDNT